MKYKLLAVTKKSLLTSMYIAAFGLYVVNVALCSGRALALADDEPSRDTGMSVNGKWIEKDGKHFEVRGFNMIGLLAAPFCDNAASVKAGEKFSDEELREAKDWHANTLRFQISQRGLTRDGYMNYIDNVIVPRVKMARDHGFVVILSMQTEEKSCGPGFSQPSDLTIKAWDRLVTKLKNRLSHQDFTYLMFELFNEPRGPISEAGWQQWRDGGVGKDLPITKHDNYGEKPVGHQALVNKIRASGAEHNVLIAEGMRLGTRLDGVPMLDDTRDPGPAQIVYAFHGYGFADADTDWDAEFGYLSKTHPVLMTEWHYTKEGCGGKPEKTAPDFLHYLHQHTVGLTPGPFDNPFLTGVTYDWNWSPTDCDNKIETRRGSGQMIKRQFADLAQQEADE